MRLKETTQPKQPLQGLPAGHLLLAFDRDDTTTLGDAFQSSFDLVLERSRFQAKIAGIPLVTVVALTVWPVFWQTIGLGNPTRQLARRYVVRGRVQGVGFRYFVEHTATALGLNGYVRNLDDGTVEVCAIGTAEELDQLSGMLWKGPRFADVRGVDESEAAMIKYRGFHILHE